MMKRSKIAVPIVFAALAIALTACAQKPAEELGGNFSGEPLYEAKREVDSALKERYLTHKENLRLAFSETEPIAGADFETAAYENGLKLISYKGDAKIVVIPDVIDGQAVLAVGENCFADSGVRAVKVPLSVTLIEKGAFADCEQMTTLQIPFVGDGRENSHFGIIFGADSYDNHATKVPKALTTVILSEGQEIIEANAFAGCKSIEAVGLPESISQIGDFAFFECRELVLLSLSSEELAVGNYAFGNCTGLYALTLPRLLTVGEGILYAANALEELTLSSFENIGYLGYLFGAEIADHTPQFVDPSLRKVILTEDSQSIPDRAFAGCYDLDEVILPEGLEEIGIRAFYACRSLTVISLPDSLKTIQDDAFFGCDNLVSVSFGQGLEKMGMQAFYGCRSLKTVSLPDRLTEISNSCFAYCKALEKIELNNITKIGKDAFFGCAALEGVNTDGIEVAEGNDALLSAENHENQT